MKKLFYSVEHPLLKVECFKMDDVDETIDAAYEVMSTNNKGEHESVFAYQPQAAIALADHVINSL